MPPKNHFKSKYKRNSNPLYSVWNTMHLRCYNKKRKDYKFYGGSGIKVSDSWKEFDHFVDDMASTYKTGLTLGRVDNNGNYCKENCRWESMIDQCNNRRNSAYIFNPQTGEKKTITEWARYFNIKITTVRSRYNLLKIRDFDKLFFSKKLPRGSKYL